MCKIHSLDPIKNIRDAKKEERRAQDIDRQNQALETERSKQAGLLENEKLLAGKASEAEQEEKAKKRRNLLNYGREESFGTDTNTLG